MWDLLNFNAFPFLKLGHIDCLDGKGPQGVALVLGTCPEYVGEG